MAGPLEDKLDRIAKRVGWRMRWQTAPLVTCPRLERSELEIFEGKRPVTLAPVWCIGSSNSTRETVAGDILSALPRRGGAA